MRKFADRNLVFNTAYPLPIYLGNNAEIVYSKLSNYESVETNPKENFESILESLEHIKALTVNQKSIFFKDWRHSLVVHGIDLVPLIVLVIFLSQMDRIRSGLAFSATHFPIYLLLIATAMFGVYWINRIAWMFSVKFLFSKKTARLIFEKRTTTPPNKFSLTRKLADMILGKLE